MSKSIITVENLSKLYTLNHNRNKEDGFRHIIEEAVRSPLRWLHTRNERKYQQKEEFWALKDVSFEIKQGDVVGIIGRNGAGKSTLLKILSRITEPTKGRVTIEGRVASLLEVGTGFHPELTGRENIFLNGAILGMSRVEIRNKFDEIVAFSEVEKFLDTPVKRYSSGMYVRLAFAVAAHLEPEILIIDEVLAVGDATFQKKCLGKMQDISAKEGRTVIFVSHQISAVTRLCPKTLWLQRGMVREIGMSQQVCQNYLSEGSIAGTERTWTDGKGPGNEWVQLTSIKTKGENPSSGLFTTGEQIAIVITYQVHRPGKVLIPNLHLHSEDGTLIFVSHDWHSGWRNKPRQSGKYETSFFIPPHLMNVGRVLVKVAITTYQPFEVHLVENDAIAFTIIEEDGTETARGDYAGSIPGAIRPMLPTKTHFIT